MPTQIFNIRNNGVGQAEAPSDIIVVYCGISAEGDVNVLKTGRNPSAVAAELKQGPLAEDACYHVQQAGVAKYMRLSPTVAGSIGAVSTSRIGSSTGTVAASVTPATFTSALQIDDPTGTPSFVDETADLASVAAGDVDPMPATEASGDQFAAGFESPFNSFDVTVATAGVGGTLIFRYWNGTALTTVAGLSDASSGLTAGTATYTITFTMPTDWVKQSLNNGPSKYYLYLEVDTVYTTNPVLSQAVINRQGPWDEYDVTVEVTKTGTLGVGEFRYSLDGGKSFSPELVIPTGGTYVITDTGVTLTFTAGGGPTFFEDGDTFAFVCTPPFYDTTAIAPAIAALQASGDTWDAIVFSGKAASASAAVTIAAALDGHAGALENTFDFGTAMIVDFGSADTQANVLSAHSAIETDYLNLVYGRARHASAKPIPGWTEPMRVSVCGDGAQAAIVGLSGDLKRVAEPGASLGGFTEVEHDEAQVATPLDGARLSTKRTWKGRSGVYIFQGRIKSAIASDIRLWPHRMVMNRSARTIYLNAQTFTGRNPRVNTDPSIVPGNPGAPGTLFEPDAQALEAPVQRALREELETPANADGNQGHVSAQNYALDRTYDSKANRRTLGVFKMVSLAYIDDAEHELSFAVAL